MGRVGVSMGMFLVLVSLVGATTARAGDDRIVYSCEGVADVADICKKHHKVKLKVTITNTRKGQKVQTKTVSVTLKVRKR